MAGRKLDDYKSLDFYQTHTKVKTSGFAAFDVNDEFYFCRFIDDKIALISQAYTSEAGRDNGIESVKKNEKLADRIRFEDRDGGKFGFSLIAGNYQEIGVSPSYDKAESAQHVAGRLRGEKSAKPKKARTAKPRMVTAAPPEAPFTEDDARIENYKPVSFYKTHGNDIDEGFDSFSKDGAYYFSYRQGGEIALISESYTSEAGRNNGIASVKTNMKLAKRYAYHKQKNGKHYFDLKAGNHQEIGTSPKYDSESDAKNAVLRLRGKLPSKAAAAAASKATSSKAKPVKKAPVKKDPAKPVSTKAETEKKSASDKAAIAATAAAAAATATAAAAKAANVEQDYKPLAFYQDHTTGREHGIETFTAENGKHYFAYFENGKIALISEGYPTTAARDTGVASVEKNIGMEDRYDFRGPLKNGKYEYRLKAGNHKEIARSVWYGSAAAAAAGAAYLMGTRKRVPAVEAKDSMPIAAVAAAPLMAASVMAATPAPKAEPVAAAAPPPVAEPIPVTPPPAAATPVDGGGGFPAWLKWLLLALIALLAMFFLFKACAGDEVDSRGTATEAGTAVTAPMVACWNGTQAKTLSACPAKITCWNGDEVTTQSACPTRPAPVTQPEPAPTFTCWDDSQVEDLANCPPVPKAEASAAPQSTTANPSSMSRTTSPQQAPTSDRNFSRNSAAGFTSAAGATAGIFSAGETPVIVRRLGTNPEFGDSRTLDAQGFYDNLNGRYALNGPDRAYLEYLAGQLGYAGWSDVSAADFTQATVANGTVGVLGYGDYHGYQYSKLDVADRTDLDAFQFASRNGRTVYFMKRCGNYFFPTQ